MRNWRPTARSWYVLVAPSPNDHPPTQRGSRCTCFTPPPPTAATRSMNSSPRNMTRPVRQAWPVRCSATRNWKVDASAPARSFRQPQVLYRGWMLTPENYARLHGAILVAGGRLTSPQQYRHCHYLPEWYPLCEDLTPATLFLSRNADFEQCWRKARGAPGSSGPCEIPDHPARLEGHQCCGSAGSPRFDRALSSTIEAVYAFGSSRRCGRKPRNATSFFTAALTGVSMPSRR